MCWAMPYPWLEPRLSVWRINISKVPGRKSGSVDSEQSHRWSMEEYYLGRVFCQERFPEKRASCNGCGSEKEVVSPASVSSANRK